MTTKIDPVAETMVIDVSAFDPHAAMTVVHRVDFHAETRELSAANVDEPETGLATTLWVVPASVHATEVVAQLAELAAASPAAARLSARPRRGLIIALGVLVVAALIGGVIRARSGHADAKAAFSQPELAPSLVSPSAAGDRRASSLSAPEPTHSAVVAPLQLTQEQVQALEADAVRALFAADEATALTRYRTLTTAGYEPAQRMLMLLERTP